MSIGNKWYKNCLDHCKLILKRYGLANYGSSATAIQLLKESGNKLVYATDNPKETYETATKCIDNHLEAGRPIIVGINNTLGNTYNEVGKSELKGGIRIDVTQIRPNI